MSVPSAFDPRRFVVLTLWVSVWVHASEIFRYFALVMPETRAFLSMVPGVAPMSWPVFVLWGAWDTLLSACIVFMFWLAAQAFGAGLRTVVIAGAASWAFFFVLFWVGMYNMALAPAQLALTALPLALIETLVAAYIASRLYAPRARQAAISTA